MNSLVEEMYSAWRNAEGTVEYFRTTSKAKNPDNTLDVQRAIGAAEASKKAFAMTLHAAHQGATLISGVNWTYGVQLADGYHGIVLRHRAERVAEQMAVAVEAAKQGVVAA